ncbi:hypothetical protein GW17_00016030 [Ensete ventricosum]|nr:hypothetical protein GW17_00016030 [Ensete ventricosum]
MDNSSGNGESSRGRPSMAEESAVLSLDSGKNCTRSDNGRNLRGPSDSSVDDKGRLGPLRLWQKVSVTEAEAALGFARGRSGVNEVRGPMRSPILQGPKK